TFRLEDADGNTVGENFTVNLDEPDQSYQIDENTEIKMRAYAPDFQEIADNGTLVSETPVPRNPAFVFEVNAGGESELSLLQIMNSTDITQNNDYSIRFVEAEQHTASVLTLKKDLTIPLVAVDLSSSLRVCSSVHTLITDVSGSASKTVSHWQGIQTKTTLA